MVEITILELNLDGAEFTANAPGSEPGEDADSDGGGLPTGLAMGVVAVLAAVALVTVARRMRGQDG